MWFTLLFALAILSERFFKIYVGIFQLSAGDAVVLLTLPWLLTYTGKMPKWTSYLVCGVFLSLLIPALLNGGYGLNSLVSVPLKLVGAGVVYYELSMLRNRSVWALVIGVLIAVLSVNMVFFTGLGFFSQEIFNRNELFSYFLSFACVFLLVLGGRNTSDKRFTGVAVFLIIWLLMLATIVQSRQSMLCAVLLLALATMYKINMKNLLPISLAFVVVLGLLAKPIYSVIDDERFNRRIATISEFDPQTRADTFRLNNALYVINNFEKAPFFGKGATSFVKEGPYQKVVHNAYLTSLYETGIFGFFVLIMCFLFMLRPLRTGWKYRRILPASLVLPSFFMLAFFVQAFFIEILGKAPFFILIGCSAYLTKKHNIFMDSHEIAKY